MTPKQQRFCEEYIIDMNATQAAIRAGYAANSANVIGCQNLAKPNIKAEIEHQKQELRKRTEYSQEIGLAKLLHAYDVAEKLKQPSAMVSAAVGANRMHGYDRDAGTRDPAVIIINPPKQAENNAKSVESEEVNEV